MNTRYLYNIEMEDVSMQIFYYERLKNSVQSVSYELKGIIESFDNIENNLKRCFSIDESNSYNFGEVRNEILGRMNYLNYVVVPALKQKINSLK